MTRYVGLLRGVSPMNCRMPALARCLGEAGFENVRTLLSSGNVAFDARARPEAALVRRIEAAVEAEFGRRFEVFLRASAALQAMIAADPFARHALPAGGKRIVSFLPEPPATLPSLPIVHEGARILAVEGREVYSVYVPTPGSPAFMVLLEKTFGKHQTTRTWDTVRKCAAA